MASPNIQYQIVKQKQTIRNKQRWEKEKIKYHHISITFLTTRHKNIKNHKTNATITSNYS